MGATHDLIVPGSGTVAAVLSTILQLCGEMKEWQDPCTRLHQRLKNVFEGLKTLEKKKKRLPPPEALDKYVTVVSTTLCYLEHYRGKKLVFRLMKHQAMMEELRVINEKTDVVVRALGLTSADTGKWKKQYEDDQRIHRELLASSVDNAQEVLAELQDARSQQETMLTLKYEVELRPEQQDAEMTKLLRTMMATVIRTSTTSVPKLPPWFLPPYEIRFDPKPFARGSFATVHRGAVIGEPPFALLDDDSVHEKLRNGEIPEKPEKMSAEVWELVAAMTNVDPTKRISLSRVLKTLKDFADGNLRSPPQAANPASELTENANLALVDTEIIVGILDNVSAMDDQAKEQSMLQLVRICVEDEERPVMYEADAIQILTNLVKSGRNNYTKLYALQCLKWAAVVDAKLPKLAFD
ncbi:hypothetical protein PF006_g11932 [Phytophthora fragariae]|uniref:Mixed lineage kinase domain-containing protein n=1 Tax=Phytophthora fragariae TaxID=53985 RepID=A0A6A3TWN0_9STRA|nr:hypothetical protein PF011_g11762 [Phytophthora fragariae]KAE9143011.1 hypothetical protein PF006_g11932 [Phytophthora fragariae]